MAKQEVSDTTLVRVSFYLPVWLERKFRIKAASNRQTISALGRDMLQQFLKDELDD